MAWTIVPKPTESSVISVNGDAEPIGLLLAITSVTSGPVTSIVTGWTDVAKPVSSTWAIVPKPTN